MYTWYKNVLMIGLLALTACTQNPTVTPVYVGDNFLALNALSPPQAGLKFTIDAPESGALGDRLSFQVTPQNSGYLWIVQVDSQDRVELLFPNAKEHSNYLRAGQPVSIPGRADYYFYLDHPLGTNLLAFVMTTESEELQAVLPPRIFDALYRIDQAAVFSRARGISAWGISERQNWGLVKQILTVQASPSQ